MPQKYLRKITVKTVLGAKPKIPEKIGDSDYLYTVMGKATGLKPYTSQYGDGNGLTGTFAALMMDPKTGERTSDVEYRAPQCFLPDTAMHDSIVGRIGSQGEHVEFAFHVRIETVSREVAPSGYMYVLEPLADPEAVDPIAAIASRVKVPALTDQSKKESKSKNAA